MQLSAGAICAPEGLFLNNAEMVIPPKLCSAQVEGACQQIGEDFLSNGKRGKDTT